MTTWMICPLPSLLPSSFVMCPYHINGDLSTDKRQALEKINPRWGGGGFCPFLSLKNITKMAGLQEKRIFLNCKLEDYPNFKVQSLPPPGKDPVVGPSQDAGKVFRDLHPSALECCIRDCTFGLKGLCLALSAKHFFLVDGRPLPREGSQ